MRSAVLGLLTTLAVAAAPGVALAGEGCKGFDVVTHIFEASDVDGSGALSLAEYTEARLERYGVRFSDYDANGDDSISFDEYLALYERHHPAEGGIES